MNETSGVFEKSNILTVHVALQSLGFQYELFSNLNFLSLETFPIKIFVSVRKAKIC